MNGESRRLRASSGTTATAPASHELHRVPIVSAGSDIRARRDAALRSVPLSDSRRDPDFRWEGWPGDIPICSVSQMGLTTREVAGEARRCRESGWARWEIAERFSEPVRARDAA